MTAGQQLKGVGKRGRWCESKARGDRLKFAEQMRWKNLHTGSGCRSVAKAIAKRTGLSL